MNTFDPTMVPVFPVITLDLRDDSSVLVDGALVHIGPDQAPTDAGVAAVANKATSLGLSAVRVRASSPDGVHHLVVTDEGEVHNLETADTTPAKRTKRGLLIGVAAATSVILIGAIAGVVALASQPDTSKNDEALPPGHGANLPVAAPAGYSQVAYWSRPVFRNSKPVPMPANHLALVTPDGSLEVVDNNSGRTLWQGVGTSSARTALNYTTVNGTPVLATSSNNSITLWELSTPTQTELDPLTPVPPREVPLGATGRVSYYGSAPLIELKNQTAAFFTPNGLTRVDIPVNARAVIATQENVVAIGAGEWWTISPDNVATSTPIPNPEGADGPPDYVSAADDTNLVVAWKIPSSSTLHVELLDISTGNTRSATSVSNSAFRSEPTAIHSPDAPTMVLGELFIDYGEHPAIVHLPRSGISAVNGSLAYGKQMEKPISYHVSGTTVTERDFSQLKSREITMPFLVNDQHAYVVTQKVDQTNVYALPFEESE